jgi:DNA-binding CsgD family transcriptional regulator
MAGDVIGRRDELLAIEEFLRAAPAGEQALLLEGDAGIGKTALWHEALRIAGERDFHVLRSRPTQSETQVAFAALGDLLAPVLNGVLPGLAPARLREPESHTLLPDTRVLGVAVISTLRALAAERPVLVAIDDSQWLDSSSAAVLAFALRRLDAAPVAVLATVRGRPLEPPLELGRSFAALRRLPIAPLSVGAVHRLLWGRLGIAVPRPVILRVHEITGGNPFFALELGRALVAGSVHAEYASVELPESLRAVVARRLTALPARVQETLAAVAALASPSVALLEALGGTSVEDVELAQRRGVVEFDGDRISFAHPLLAPACYEALPLHRRRRLHRRLAALDVDLEERARHLAVAATGPDEEVAAALDAAAAHARGRGAAQAAADLAERAVSLTRPDASEPLSRRRITAAEYCRYAGDMKKAAVLLEEAAASAEPGPVRADALSRLAGARGMAEGFPAAVRLLRRALAEPGLEARQEVNIRCELTWMAHVAGKNREAARHAEAGLRRAEQLGEPATLALALATVAQVTFARTGRIRHDLLDQAWELEQTLAADRYASAQRWTWHVGLPMRLSPSRVTLALLLGRSGRHEESRALWNALISEATERNDPDVVRCIFHRAQVEMVAGQWNTASQLCDDAIQLTRELGLEMFEPLCLSILAEIDAYRGDTEKARGTIPDLLRLVETSRFRWQTFRLRIALAVLELSYDEAAASLRHAAQLLDDFEELDGYLAQLAGSAGIEALVANGELDRAAQLLALIDARAAGGDTALRPLVFRCRGLLLAAHGDPDGAIASLEAAAASEVNPFELARTLLALGSVQRRARHKRDARESLLRAADAFEQLGARVWLEKTHAELRRIGGRTASSAGLSETERQIVELVAAGRRNSEVAAELSLSPNTVAWNLSKVYRKLGVSSRTELAARMAGTAHE